MTYEFLFLNEQKLLTPEKRKNPNKLKSYLSEDFFEICSNGELMYLDQIIKVLSQEKSSIMTAKGFKALQLEENLVLVTFKFKRVDQVGNVSESLRSSIWKLINGHWKMIFHQGSKII